MELELGKSYITRDRKNVFLITSIKRESNGNPLYRGTCVGSLTEGHSRSIGYRLLYKSNGTLMIGVSRLSRADLIEEVIKPKITLEW